LYTGPSNDQFPYNSATDVNNGPITVAVTCYKGNAGDGPFENVAPPYNAPQNFWSHDAPKIPCYQAGNDCYGIFWRYTYLKGGVKLKEITDGTSKTFLIGESSPEDGNSPAWSSDGDWGVTAVPVNQDWRSSGNCLDAAGNPTFGRAECWSQMRGFRGYHPGGVQFGMTDGSVRFISDSINHLTYRALSTKSLGETITDAY
jgi:hypothetical protein